MAEIKLTEWDLTAHYPYTPILHRSLETGVVLGPILPAIKAKVPGSVYMDLLSAGYIKDPYFDMDSLLCEWVLYGVIYNNWGTIHGAPEIAELCCCAKI